MPLPPKISVSEMLPMEAVLFTPEGGKEDVYVMILIDPVNNIFTAIKVSDKSPFNFNGDDKVIKLEALDSVPIPLPSVIMGPMLLALP